MKAPVEKRARRWTEEIGIAAGDLVATVKKLLAEGNARRLIIRNAGGQRLLDIPLTAGVIIGGTLVLLAPVLAALGALVALLSKVKFGIVREYGD
jgi:hypothetical protein